MTDQFSNEGRHAAHYFGYGAVEPRAARTRPSRRTPTFMAHTSRQMQLEGR